MKIKHLLLLLFLASLWGPSFLLIKVALEEIPPITLAALRIAIAAVGINLLLWWKGGHFIKDWRFWKHVTIAGFFAHALPFISINWGEMYIDSALASILNGLTPIFTMILAHFFIANDRMRWPKIVGTLLGFTGLLILISPNLSWEATATTLGILAVSIGASSYAIALVYARLKLVHVPPLYAPAAQLLVATIYMVPFSLWIDGPPKLFSLSFTVIGAVLTLGLLGTALAFIIYYKILDQAGASFLSLVTYLMPVYGVVLGILVLDESLNIATIIGAIVILLGLAIANGIHVKAIKGSPNQKSTQEKGLGKVSPFRNKQKTKCVKSTPIVQVYIR